MDRRDVIAWVLSVCSALRLSQAKTLSELVAATLSVGRVSLAAIGRALTGPSAAKQRIKRTWRFVANQRVVISDAMSGLVRQWAKRYQKLQRRGRRRRPPLLIAFDWTEIRDFHTLAAPLGLVPKHSFGPALPSLGAEGGRGRKNASPLMSRSARLPCLPVDRGWRPVVQGLVQTPLVVVREGTPQPPL
jgi:predicted nucleic acid-binding protein